MLRLISEISAVLGEPGPYEIKRKFLIEYPDVAQLERLPGCTRVEIIQTYLKPRNDSELRRVRQRGADGHYIYFETVKLNVKDPSTGYPLETERRLTQDEYLGLLMEADTTKRALRKPRYCLAYDRQYFSIDLLPFWDRQAMLSIETNSESEEIRFPDFVRVIREVTGLPEYRNSALATR